MKIYIDQSGKVEYTGHNTVVAYSNGSNKTVYISAVEKRKIQKLFRSVGKPEMFIYTTFASLVYLLIADKLENVSMIIIDREYWGKESVIKDQILRIIRTNGHTNFDSTKIEFGLVGKKRGCHIAAISVLRKKVKPDKIVIAKDVLKLIL